MLRGSLLPVQELPLHINVVCFLTCKESIIFPQGHLGSYLRLRAVGGGLHSDGWSLDLDVQKTWTHTPLGSNTQSKPISSGHIY